MLVLNELIYISKKKYGVPYDLTIEFIEFNVLPYMSIINLGEEEYSQAVKFLVNYKLKPSDALHLGAMLINGINTIISEDKEFDKIQLVKRLWL